MFMVEEGLLFSYPGRALVPGFGNLWCKTKQTSNFDNNNNNNNKSETSPDMVPSSHHGNVNTETMS